LIISRILRLPFVGKGGVVIDAQSSLADIRIAEILNDAFKRWRASL
jgi:hypothetical protein